MGSAPVSECEGSITDTEPMSDGIDDEVWSKWSSMQAKQRARPYWITDGFSSLPYLRR